MRIFISYRRADSGGHVIPLASILEESSVGGQRCEIFIDVDDISAGRNFVDAMFSALKSCDVVLAVIGRHWLIRDGVRRLAEATDPVRLEMKAALETDTSLIAVLVDGGSLPSASELPADMRELRHTASVELHDATFEKISFGCLGC